jgi:hypothetical protein
MFFTPAERQWSRLPESLRRFSIRHHWEAFLSVLALSALGLGAHPFCMISVTSIFRFQALRIFEAISPAAQNNMGNRARFEDYALHVVKKHHYRFPTAWFPVSGKEH